MGKLNQDERVADTMEISKASLKSLGYIANVKGLVKILGDGEYTKHLTFLDIDVFSASAKEKIAAPGTIDAKPSKMYRKIEKVVKTLKKVASPKKTKAPVVEKAIEKVAPKKETVVEEKKVAPKKAVAKIEEPVEEKKASPVKKSASKTTAPKKPVEKKAPSKKSTTEDKPAPKKA